MGEKVAVVTGAARGIGLGVSEKFLSQGYRVALLDVDAVTLAQTAENMSEQSGASPSVTLTVECDVSDPQQVQAAVNKVAEHFGRIDALVNNAGVAVFKPALETTFEDWLRIMATNLNGPFLCTQACVPVMLKTGGGSVVNIASISGVRASTLRIAYGTSKAALMHLTKQQAVEYGNVGVRVNAVAPGPVETAMARQVHSADIRTSYRDAIPLARYGAIQEIAEAVAFLCSNAASYINGQILAVDGGFDAAGVGLPSLRGET